MVITGCPIAGLGVWIAQVTDALDVSEAIDTFD